MIKVINKANCCGCHACFQVCPKDAIQMETDEEGFLYPIVNLSKCVNCGKCDKVCPEIKAVALSMETQVYAAYRKEFEKRVQSQSGGVFARIAEDILAQGGVAFGAAFNETWKLQHCIAEDKTQLQKLQGSKYVQSEIGNTFIQVKTLLDQGEKVLYSGTPCQIQGLKKFLGKDYETLVTIDLICHGVPSPEVWKKYLEEFLNGSQLVKFVQKDKMKNNAIFYQLKNGSEREESYETNAYSKGFNKNLFLRPSCHQCSFKGIERCSDITLGDFWGIEKFYPEFGDRYGISAVLVHTKNGLDILENIKDSLEVVECNSDMLVAENPCVIQSSAMNTKRAVFFEKWKTNNIIPLIEQLLQPSLSDILKYRIKKMYYKLRICLSRIKKYIFRKLIKN